jgi:hypothetical protein
VRTTIPFLRFAVASRAFADGAVHTRLVDEELLDAFAGVQRRGAAAGTPAAPVAPTGAAGAGR